MKQRALRRIARRLPPSMPIQPLEIEHARAEPEHPDLDGARHDACIGRDARPCNPVDERLPERLQNHVDACDLSRQRLEGQHALAMSTIATTCERDLERHRCVANVESALDSAPSKSQISAAAGRAATAGNQLVTGNIDDRGVLARLDIEYEDHVLTGGSGD